MRNAPPDRAYRGDDDINLTRSVAEVLRFMREWQQDPSRPRLTLGQIGKQCANGHDIREGVSQVQWGSSRVNPLKQYGLVKRSGNKKNQGWVVTERGLRINIDECINRTARGLSPVRRPDGQGLRP